MSFKRKCTICELKGIETEYFNVSKKICNTCIEKISKQKEENKLNSIKKKKEYMKNWRLNNKEYGKKYLSEWSKNNKDKMREYSKRYYTKNKEKTSTRTKEYFNRRRKDDNLFRLITNLRNLVKNSLIKQGYSKKSSTYKIIGQDYQNFKDYIENQFREDMSWDNYGEWHLDHITPISSAKNEEEAYKLCNYKNFQPLWALENQRKSNKF